LSAVTVVTVFLTSDPLFQFELFLSLCRISSDKQCLCLPMLFFCTTCASYAS